MSDRTPIIEKALEKLKEKNIKLFCPTCEGQPNWDILDDPVTPLFMDGKLKKYIMGKGHGLIMFACRECGFVVFHSLNILLNENET